MAAVVRPCRSTMICTSGSDGLADGGHGRGRLTHAGVRLQGPGTGHGQDLEGIEAVGHGALGQLGHQGRLHLAVGRLRRTPAEVVVEAHLLAHGAAEQLPHGHAQVLALDVPEGLVDATDRGHLHGPAAEELLAIEDLPEVLDAMGVLPHDQRREVLDGAEHPAGLDLEAGLTPADEAGLVGLDAHEDPVAATGVDDGRAHSGDAHRSLAGRVSRPRRCACGRARREPGATGPGPPQR